MILSDSHRFIFVAVPKVGSSSTEEVLTPYKAPLSDAFNRHATCLKLQRDLPPSVWEDYFKFAFVRDPYDRMLSWYFYRQREPLGAPDHPRHHLYTGDKTFAQFIHGFSSNELMFKQVDFIAPHQGGLLVDFVGRFENLQADFSRICQRLSLPEITLPKVRASGRSSAREVNLWTPELRRIVNDYFREDFELLDYPMISE
ncbi:MAG: sulfotransferase family protein [Gammaproteobacteria bacterium]|nr:sulfotransferase family protein [Gammaproteobacteria bacterium]